MMVVGSLVALGAKPDTIRTQFLMEAATLGLLGGGGSMLTLPILTYVAGMATRPAIASSLFVVAVTSATGVIALPISTVSPISRSRSGTARSRSSDFIRSNNCNCCAASTPARARKKKLDRRGGVA